MDHHHLGRFLRHAVYAIDARLRGENHHRHQADVPGVLASAPRGSSGVVAMRETVLTTPTASAKRPNPPLNKTAGVWLLLEGIGVVGRTVIGHTPALVQMLRSNGDPGLGTRAPEYGVGPCAGSRTLQHLPINMPWEHRRGVRVHVVADAP